jgi:hypothetical protein
MKRKLFLYSATCLFIYSCKREVSCTCKDANGSVVKYSSLTSNKSDREVFKAECEKTKTATYSTTATVYTPCTVN